MGYIQTVLGQVDPDRMGFCHSHEHILLSRGVSFERNPALLLDDPEKSLKELLMFKAAGGGAIVEAQPVGCNRMEEGLKQLSQRSGVHIIASTGFHKMIFYPKNHWIFFFNEDILCQIFVHEIEQGMYVGCDRTPPNEYMDSRAGQIKCALDTEGLTEQYRKLFMAAGKAAKITGAPMMVHIESGSDPEALADFLEDNEILPKKLIFCHLDRSVADLEVHKRIAKRGIFLEYDTIGRAKYHSDDKEAEMIKEIVASGYEDMLLASLDSTRARLKSYSSDGVGLDYIHRVFIPLSKEKGISDRCIQKMMVINPRKAFAIE